MLEGLDFHVGDVRGFGVCFATANQLDKGSDGWRWERDDRYRGQGRKEIIVDHEQHLPNRGLPDENEGLQPRHSAKHAAEGVIISSTEQRRDGVSL